MLTNKTKRRTILKDVRIRADILGKAIGLMFSKKKEQALVFVNWRESYTPLHMFFVFYSIDVLYLDSKKKVLEIKDNFRPFTVYHPKNRAKYIIELPAGTAEKKGIGTGDVLSF